MKSTDVDAVEASLTLKLKAKSGYGCTFEYEVSARQWGAIVKLCEKFALENERSKSREASRAFDEAGL